MKQSCIKEEIERHTVRVKKLIRDNNLIYTVKAEYSQTIYRINKGWSYYIISDAFRDNRLKCMTSIHLSARHQFSLYIWVTYANSVPYSALLLKIWLSKPVDSLWYWVPWWDPHTIYMYKVCSLLIYLYRSPEAVLNDKED